MKYKPEPECEKASDFKPGDKIIAYTSWSVFEKKVKQVLGDHIETEGYHTFHFKQCRKLIEEKPREWWIKYSTNAREDDIRLIDPQNISFTHVREVIDEA